LRTRRSGSEDCGSDARGARTQGHRRDPEDPHLSPVSDRRRRLVSDRRERANISNSAFWKARTSSGSSRSANVVNPETSANRTVTCRRSAARWRASGLATGGASRAGVSCLGMAATIGCRRPHRGQKAKAGDSSKPQSRHAIEVDRQTLDRFHHSTGMRPGSIGIPLRGRGTRNCPDRHIAK
jgi:hypothetical protein